MELYIQFLIISLCGVCVCAWALCQLAVTRYNQAEMLHAVRINEILDLQNFTIEKNQIWQQNSDK